MKTEFELDDELLRKLNLNSRRELTADEVYTFPVILCDNEIDRDNERFSLEALEELSALFVGKTGVFDHEAKGENQTARIFDTELLVDEERLTENCEAYTALVGKAYMVRTDGNKDLIAEIDAGIKKEVSVSCSVKSEKCSICGCDKRQHTCCHIKGKSYGGKRCHTVLCDVTDAYEWSFVAVPAQRNAGVSKRHTGNSDDSISVLKSQISVLEKQLDIAEEEIRCEIIKLCYVCNPIIPPERIKCFLERMSLQELVQMKSELSQYRHDELKPQLFNAVKQHSQNNQSFKL